jgi:tight adherence protein B
VRLPSDAGPGPGARRRELGPSPAVAGLVAAGGLVVVGVAVRSPLLAGPAAVAAAVAGRLVEAMARRRRRTRRRAEVVAFVDGLTRSVRSGATIAGALAEAGRDGSLPGLDPELALVRAELAAGRPLATALDDWSRRATDADLRLLAGTVAVLAATGGAAAPSLDAVARTVRHRAASSAEVRALSSQATASAVVLVVAPAVFAVVLASVDPRLGRFLVHHPAGAACVAVGLALDGVGLWWMQRIIDGGTR